MVSLLLSTPGILLLDEPTNHLDDAAAQYLTSMSSTWRGPVLIVGHDREFLDETVVSILDLDPAPRPFAQSNAEDGLITIGVTRFSGTYSNYLVSRHDARQRWQWQYEEEQAQLKRLRAAVTDNQVVGHDDWRPRTEDRNVQKFFADRNAKVVARTVNDARSRLAELEQRQIVKPPRQLTFQGLIAAEQTRPAFSPDEQLIRADNVAIQHRLAPTSLTIAAGDKVLMTGANGVGKSTLLHLLADQLPPSQGSIHQHGDISIGLLTQESHFDDAAANTAGTVYARAIGIELAEKVPL